jgi:hypothetical protein
MANSRNDQVFGVSLSEIAFTLMFVLMLLLGFMVLKERADKDVALRKLESSRQTENAQAAVQALKQAEERMVELLRRQGVANPEKVVEALVAGGTSLAEQERQQEQIQDLNRRLVALDAFRGEIEKAAQKPGQSVVRERVEQALNLQQELRKQAKEKLNRDLQPGQEVKLLAELVEAAKALSASADGAAIPPQVELGKLRSQVAFYENRDKLRGLVHPPCWMNKQGGTEYIFNVQTMSDGFVVSRGWPAYREADARASPGFDQITAKGNGAMTPQQFIAGATPFLDYGKKQSPECRHFVYLSTSISEADKRDEARQVVNRYFYIDERKAPVTP